MKLVFQAIIGFAASSLAQAEHSNNGSIVPTNLRFGHVGLSVVNITREMEWYQRMLGFQFVDTQQIGSDLAVQLVILKNSANVRIEFRQQQGSIPDARNATDVQSLGNMRGLLNWSLQVEDVNTIYERLVAAGVDSFQAPVDIPGGARFCMIRDPEGNIIELIQH